LVGYFDVKKTSQSSKSLPPSPSDVGNLSETSGLFSLSDRHKYEDYIREFERLLPLSILDFPSELIANSISNLWGDLDTEVARKDFLLFHRGWVGHAVLLGCIASRGAEVVERLLEIACFLDLLCQEHSLAVATVGSLKMNAISRLSVWKQVRPSLCHKMDEILNGGLAHGAPSSVKFRAPRDASLEYWLLSRAYVNDESLLQESLNIEVAEAIGDVEQRLNQLEQLVEAIDDRIEATEASLDNQSAIGERVDIDLSDLQLSETETESDSALSHDSSFSDKVGNPYVEHVARETRERVSQHLEMIKRDIHTRTNIEIEPICVVESLSVLPAAQPRPRLINPLDQRSMFRVGAQKDGNSQRRSHITVTNPDDPVQIRPKKKSDHKQSRSRQQEASVTIPTDADGRWKRSGTRG
jgi:hypothetical protein